MREGMRTEKSERDSGQPQIPWKAGQKKESIFLSFFDPFEPYYEPYVKVSF